MDVDGWIALGFYPGEGESGCVWGVSDCLRSSQRLWGSSWKPQERLEV